MNTSKLNLLKLKVKNKSLAEEARIIRKIENDPCDLFGSLHWHRIWDVRNEARATHLAVAFLKEKPYSSVEKNCKDNYKLHDIVLPRVVDLVYKYGNYNKNDVSEKIGGWLTT